MLKKNSLFEVVEDEKYFSLRETEFRLTHFSRSILYRDNDEKITKARISLNRKSDIKLLDEVKALQSLEFLSIEGKISIDVSAIDKLNQSLNTLILNLPKGYGKLNVSRIPITHIAVYGDIHIDFNTLNMSRLNSLSVNQITSNELIKIIGPKLVRLEIKKSSLSDLSTDIISKLTQFSLSNSSLSFKDLNMKFTNLSFLSIKDSKVDISNIIRNSENLLSFKLWTDSEFEEIRHDSLKSIFIEVRNKRQFDNFKMSCPSLENLVITNIPFSQISDSLNGSQELKTLILQNTGINNGSRLYTLKKLEYLEISDMRSPTIDKSRFEKLKHLIINNNKL